MGVKIASMFGVKLSLSVCSTSLCNSHSDEYTEKGSGVCFPQHEKFFQMQLGFTQVPSRFRIAGVVEPRAHGREAALFVTPERLRNARALLSPEQLFSAGDSSELNAEH